jgi:hypothetical protein
MGEIELLVIYKSLRLPILVAALLFITWYTYGNKARREKIEQAKFRMLEED